MTDVQLSPAKRLAAVIEAKKDALAKLIPPKDMERFTANVLSELRPMNAQGKPNKLLQCSPESFYACAYQSAILGLQPGKLGHVYLVPYGKTATLIIGYKGLIAAAKKHPDVLNVHAEVIFEGDEYHREGGTGKIHHQSPISGDRSDSAIVGAYCWVSIRDTDEKISKDLNREQIEKLRNRSAAANGNFWKNDYAAMVRKTVIRHLFNGGEVPMSAQMEAAVTYENEQDKMADVVAVRDEPRHSIVGDLGPDPTTEDLDSPSGSEVVFPREVTKEEMVEEFTKTSEIFDELNVPEEERFITPEELEAPVKRTRSPNKKTLLKDIGDMGHTDATITSAASDLTGQTVLDIEVLSAAQLVRLQEMLREKI